MKRIILSLVLVSFGATTLGAQITDTEREAAIAELTATHEALMASVEGLSEAQLNYKSSETAWSIAECVEHITISENTIIGMMQGALQTPADASKREEVKMTDDQLLAIIRDRSNKVKTSEAFEPSGKFGSYEETLKAFVTKRTENIDMVKNTEADLRNHYGQLPFGTVDALQVVLFMSGHTERHTKQIDEVKAHENFPSE